MSSSRNIKNNFYEISNKIKLAGGSLNNISIVAVTKGKQIDDIISIFDLPIYALAENYSNELIEKANQTKNYLLARSNDSDKLSTQNEQGMNLSTVGEKYANDKLNLQGIEWHFVGQIQRRKIKTLISQVSLWQSVDRFDEAKTIAAYDPRAKILVEVNGYDLALASYAKMNLNPDDDDAGQSGQFLKQLAINNKGNRGGVRVSELHRLIDDLSGLDLHVGGLMTVAPLGGYDVTKAAFDMLAFLTDDCALPICSMGMSSDFEIAVSSGSNMIRLGRALFHDL